MTDIFPAAMGADVLRMLGVIGFLGYVSLYTCLSLRVLHSDSIAYFAGNICAASLVLISLTQDFNLASAMIQCFWIAMGIPAIILRLRRRRSDRIADETQARARMARLAAGATTPSARIRPVAEGHRRQGVSAPLVLVESWTAGKAPGPAAMAETGCRTGTAG